jgi:hypothetical protein
VSILRKKYHTNELDHGGVEKNTMADVSGAKRRDLRTADGE